MILVAQSIFSLILISRPVVQDEATYIDAGNAEIAHWLHGAPTLPYAQFLSGSPALYPPLSATVANSGGLVATRLMSLCFMLVTTGLLWSVARRLLGGLVPVYAAALFAATASVQYLGALATYDALALMLLATAGWCAIRAAEASSRARIVLLAVMCLLMLLANATKYASALWDPVLVAMAGLAEARRQGWNAGLATGAVTGLGALLLLAIAGLAAGPAYWKGILFSTLNRTANSGMSAATILASAAGWVGVIAVLAVAGAILLSRTPAEPPLKALGWVLAAAVFLAPLDQARIGVIVSLFKHVGFGAWFAAIPAGYAVCVLLAAVAARSRRAAAGAGKVIAQLVVAAIAVIAVIGILQAQGQSLPVLYSQRAVARLRPMLYQSRGPWLGDSPTVIIYYAHTSSLRWRNTYGFTYEDPRTGKSLTRTAAYVAAIRNRYFSVVVLRAGRMSNPVDRAITRVLKTDPSYHLTVIPQRPSKVLVWRLAGGAGGAGGRLRLHHHHGRAASGGGSAAAM